MATVLGQRTTGNISAIQRRPDLQAKVMRLEPDKAPLTVITRQMKNSAQVTNSTTFQWTEKERLSRFGVVNGAVAGTSATSVVVTNGAQFSAGTLVKNTLTSEIFEVVSVSTNTLTVVRGIGNGGVGVAIADTTPLLILGRAAEEGGTSLQPIANDPTTLSNYTQIFKRTVEISGSAGSETNAVNPHDWTLQHEDESLELLVDMEQSFLHGKADNTTLSINGKPTRTTGGVLSFATQNGVNAGGILTEAGFETFLRGAFRYGSTNKTLFASPLLVSVLNNFSQTKLKTDVGDNTYGVSVTQWISPHGTVNIVKDNLLEGATYGGYGILLDMGRGNVSYRYLGGGPFGDRDLSLYKDRQAPDRDGKMDEWICEAGLQFGQSKTHAVLSGVTG
jgi:hypothetical protein